MALDADWLLDNGTIFLVFIRIMTRKWLFCCCAEYRMFYVGSIDCKWIFWHLNASAVESNNKAITYLNDVKMFEICWGRGEEGLETIKANFTGNLVGWIKAIGGDERPERFLVLSWGWIGACCVCSIVDDSICELKLCKFNVVSRKLSLFLSESLNCFEWKNRNDLKFQSLHFEKFKNTFEKTFWRIWNKLSLFSSEN